MLVVVILAVFVLGVVWLATRQNRVQAKSCCSSAPWPPVDLVADPAYARDEPELP